MNAKVFDAHSDTLLVFHEAEIEITRTTYEAAEGAGFMIVVYVRTSRVRMILIGADG